MGLSATVKKTSLDIMQVVKRPAAVYGIATHTLFTIVGGPVWIKGLFFYANEAVDDAGNGTTMIVQVCGVAADSHAPTAVATRIGRTCVWPLSEQVPIPDVAFNPMATILGMFSVLASPGSDGGDDITVAVATASTVGTCSWYVLYERMEPDAAIIVA